MKNKSVCYTIVNDIKPYHNQHRGTVYKLQKPFTLVAERKGSLADSYYYIYLDKIAFNILKVICTSKLSLFIMLLIAIFLSTK